jgi:hypothetical protein
VIADRATVVADAAHAFWTGLRHDRTLSPRAQAEAAHYVGGLSIDALEARILAERGLSLGRAA